MSSLSKEILKSADLYTATGDWLILAAKSEIPKKNDDTNMGRTGLACPCWSIRQDVDVGMMRRNDCQPLRYPRSSDDHCLRAWCDRANCDNDHSRRGRWIFCAGWTVWAASRSCSSLPDRQQDRWSVHRLSIQV